MKVLLVNKFLYQKGGAETYVFKLGDTLTKNGHSVEYFGLENEKNIVGNSVGAYVSDMDFDLGIRKNLFAIYLTKEQCKSKISHIVNINTAKAMKGKSSFQETEQRVAVW